MNSRNAIVTIVGGGLAGLTLGIALRRRDVEVEIVEAGHYPRHRVCGEFINGRGLEVLAGLELLAPLREAGGLEARTARFHPPGAPAPVRALPRPAFCLSRFTLDAVLARRFTDLGGHLAEGARWTESLDRPGVVRATGRRPAPASGADASTGGAAGRTAGQARAPRWYGVKAHAEGLALEADLEMHFGRRGYVGICRVESGRANVCGLFREAPASRPGPRDLAAQFGDGLDPALRQRLEAATWDPASVCTVGGLPLHVGLPDSRDASAGCAIGDAAVMIPPLTGNGMSMALESAAMAVEPLVDYAAGRRSWEECRRAVAVREHALFRRRLRWANLLHRVLFQGGAGRLLLAAAVRSPVLWGLCFRATR
jgi:flavin-dependent dehydrogenase